MSPARRLRSKSWLLENTNRFFASTPESEDSHDALTEMPSTRRLRSKRWLLDNTQRFHGKPSILKDLSDSELESEPKPLPARRLRSKRWLLDHTDRFSAETPECAGSPTGPADSSPAHHTRSKCYLSDDKDDSSSDDSFSDTSDSEDSPDSEIEAPTTRRLRSKRWLLDNTTRFADENRKPFRFLDLPPELRNRIYSILLEDEHHPLHLGYKDKRSEAIVLKRTTKKGPKAQLCPQILRTCHQINVEATPILYADNTFSFTHGSILQVPKILARLASSLKYIRHFSLYVTSLVGLRKVCIILGAARELRSFRITGLLNDVSDDELAYALEPLLVAVAKNRKEIVDRRVVALEDVIQFDKWKGTDDEHYVEVVGLVKKNLMERLENQRRRQEEYDAIEV